MLNSSKYRFTHDHNDNMISVEPASTANGFLFLVNENALVWKGDE